MRFLMRDSAPASEAQQELQQQQAKQSEPGKVSAVPPRAAGLA